MSYNVYEDGMDPEARKCNFTTYVVDVPWKTWKEKAPMCMEHRPVVEIGVDNQDGMLHIIRGTWEGEPIKTNALKAEDYQVWLAIFDWLIEWELAEWKSIGPEDREIFATDKLIGESTDGREARAE